MGEGGKSLGGGFFFFFISQLLAHFLYLFKVSVNSDRASHPLWWLPQLIENHSGNSLHCTHPSTVYTITLLRVETLLMRST